MASLDFLSPSSAPYPATGTSQSCASGSAMGNPVAASSLGDSWLNRLFAPRYVDYPIPLQLAPAAPMPAVSPQIAPAPLPAVAPVPTLAPASSAPSADSPASIAPSPVTVVIAPWGVGGVNGTAPIAPTGTPSTGGNGASAAPIATPTPAPTIATPTPAPITPASPVVTPVATPIAAPTAPADSDSSSPLLTRAQAKILRAFVFNPSFEACERTAQEEFLEDEIGEEMDRESTGHMVRQDAAPVAFVVPDGCNAVDLLYGPIEANPSCGCDADLEQIVTVGEAKLGANVRGIDAPLTPGDQVMITVPWRAASWVDLPAGRLRLPILLHFYDASAE